MVTNSMTFLGKKVSSEKPPPPPLRLGVDGIVVVFGRGKRDVPMVLRLASAEVRYGFSNARGSVSPLLSSKGTRADAFDNLLGR